jgi:MYXO-CTERM domain-containing protein
LRSLTSTTSDAAAWDALFHSFNVRRGNGDIGYAQSTRKTIAVKINQNPTNQGNTDYYANDGVSDDANGITASPHLILSLVNSLVAAGVPETNIIISDPTSLNHQWGGPRTIGDSIYKYVHPLHPGVHFVDGVGKQGRELATWPTTDQIVYVPGKGGNETLGTKIAQVFLDAGFIINMAIMKAHHASVDGPTGCFKNHYGVISGQRHGPIYGNASNYYSNTIEPMGHQELGEKEMLFIMDGLYGSSTAQVAPTKWKMAPFNNAWPSSVLMSQDAVAIDSVEFDFLNTEFGLLTNSDYYLYEAASIPNASGQKKSGTVYRPTAGSTAILGSLGVHEHWNNATDKKYSRNLDPVNGTGIELLSVVPSLSTDAGIASDSGNIVAGPDAASAVADAKGTASTGGKGAADAQTGGGSAGATSDVGTGGSGGATPMGGAGGRRGTTVVAESGGSSGIAATGGAIGIAGTTVVGGATGAAGTGGFARAGGTYANGGTTSASSAVGGAATTGTSGGGVAANTTTASVSARTSSGCSCRMGGGDAATAKLSAFVVLALIAIAFRSRRQRR